MHLSLLVRSPFIAGRLTNSKHLGNGKGLVVYGASSSVGAYAVQLAKRAGFFVVGVAGSSADYAKSIGADEVVDYRNKESNELVRLP